MTFRPSFLPLDDYLALPRPRQTWLVEPVLPAGGLANLFGAPKVSKSFAALGLAEAVGDLRATDWLGLAVRQHGQVLYLQLDTPRSLWADRLVKLRAGGHQLRGVALADRESQSVAYPWDMLDTACENWLREQVAYYEPVLVVYDTIRQLHHVNEDKSSEMEPVVSRLIAATAPAAVLIVSHTRKENLNADRRADMVDEGRGSNYLASVADGLLMLTGSGSQHRKLRYKGRATDEQTLHLEQDRATGLHGLCHDPVAEALEGGEASVRERARSLARKLDISESAARARLRRVHEAEN